MRAMSSHALLTLVKIGLRMCARVNVRCVRTCHVIGLCVNCYQIASKYEFPVTFIRCTAKLHEHGNCILDKVEEKE